MVHVIIRHPKTGAEYEISSSDFKRGKHVRVTGQEDQSYEDAGYRIVSQADGTPYEAPAERGTASHGEHAPS